MCSYWKNYCYCSIALLLLVLLLLRDLSKLLLLVLLLLRDLPKLLLLLLTPNFTIDHLWTRPSTQSRITNLWHSKTTLNAKACKIASRFTHYLFYTIHKPQITRNTAQKTQRPMQRVSKIEEDKGEICSADAKYQTTLGKMYIAMTF